MLFIEERGSGDAVVLLHGTPTTPDHLRPLAERLAERHRTLLVHLPGYGRSDGLEPYDVERSHDLVEEALAARGVVEAHFIGHSGGAYRAFAHATRGAVRPLSVTALGAVSHFPAAAREGFAAFAALLRAGSDVRPLFRDLMLAPRAREDDACVVEVTSWATASAPSHLADELDAFAAARDLRPELARLSVPILLRVGALDTATPPERTQEVAAVVPHSVVQIVEHVGHALLIEDFEATARAIEDALRRPAIA
jgi:pimeloyl-ACP methyl ester carboxylesterase